MPKVAFGIFFSLFTKELFSFPMAISELGKNFRKRRFLAEILL